VTLPRSVYDEIALVLIEEAERQEQDRMSRRRDISNRLANVGEVPDQAEVEAS
jgi:hypothetical protein